MGQIIAKHTSDAPIFNVYFKTFPGGHADPPRGASRLRRSLSEGNPQFLLQLSSKLPGQLPPKVSLEPCAPDEMFLASTVYGHKFLS